MSVMFDLRSIMVIQVFNNMAWPINNGFSDYFDVLQNNTFSHVFHI